MHTKSIFHVPRAKSELVSANQGMADLHYEEVAALRNIKDALNVVNFANGVITYRFHPASGSWWLPSRSYFRIDIQLSDAAGNILTKAEDIAPNMGLGSCLFSKMQYKINDKTVSEISEHCAQVDALKQRMSKTGQWLKTTGDNFNLWEGNFDKRQNKVILDSVDLDEVRYAQTAPDVAGANNGLPLEFLDLQTPNQVQITAANQLIFTANGGTAIPDLRNIFKTGERVYINDGAEKTRLITEVQAATLIVDGAALTAVGAANLIAQVRWIRPEIDGAASADRKVKTLSLIWQPPLSIFDIPHAIPGSCKHEIDLVPFSDTIYQKNAIESALADIGVANFSFQVTDMLFYACMCEGPIVEKDTYMLDLSETRLQMSQITTNNRSQYTLDISPSTHAVTVAFQDSAAETNTLYSQTKFKIRNSEELNLTNFYVRYSGKQKPVPDYRPVYSVAANQDNLVEQYARSLLYSGAYYDSSAETLKEWRERGMYMHFAWPRTGTDRETRCYVSTQFSALTDNPRLLLFNHYKKVCILRYENAQCIEILINEV